MSHSPGLIAVSWWFHWEESSFRRRLTSPYRRTEKWNCSFARLTSEPTDKWKWLSMRDCHDHRSRRIRFLVEHLTKPVGFVKYSSAVVLWLPCNSNTADSMEDWRNRLDCDEPMVMTDDQNNPVEEDDNRYWRSLALFLQNRSIAQGRTWCLRSAECERMRLLNQSSSDLQRDHDQRLKSLYSAERVS